jgi:anti-sigma-K factor RskA
VSSSDDLHDLAAAYALDALEPPERDLFEEHYRSCEVCAREVEEFREVAGFLAAGESADDGPDELRARILASIPGIAQDARVIPLRSRSRRITTVALSLAAALMLVIGLATLRPSSPDEFEQVLRAEDAAHTQLAPTSGASGGDLEIVWSAEEGAAAVTGEVIADPGADATYQLWVIEGGAASPSGLFRPEDGEVRALVELPAIASEDASFGVTIEPEGGSEQPTSDVLYMGPVQSA